jgi:hypothetical protein
MGNLPFLSLVTFLPLLGAAFILLIRGEPDVVARNARNVALLTSTATFLLSLGIWFNFDTSTADFQFEERALWMPAFNISYHMGVDGISVLFVLLSTLLIPVCILASWESITSRVKEYMIAFLVMETMLVGTFCALDLILFYIFFEGTLIPMFLIIGVWGGPRRVYSAFKFFLYTLAGSVLMLLALLTIYLEAGTTDIPTLLQHDFPVGLPRRVRGQAADVAGAHLASGRARGSADRGLGDPGGRAAEIRRLRVPAVLAADVPGGVGHLRAADLRAQHRRGDLHLAGGARPGGHEEADRVLLGGAYGVRHRRRLQHDPARHRGRDLPDAEPRRGLGGAVPRGGRGLRPQALA